MPASATPATIGFVGLGDMGGPMAGNMAKAGLDVLGYDRAGTAERASAGVRVAADLAAVAAGADAVFVSVPDGKASLAVIDALLAAPDRRFAALVDLSTIGVDAAEEGGRRLAEAGIAHIDAPVSGGRTGALAASIAVMAAGPVGAIEALRPVFAAFSRRLFVVGDRAGQGQAMKLLNNYLSATAMAATTEAIHFGLAQGLDFRTMLDVLNASTGQNTSTSDKFPNRILTQTYDAGFRTALMAKDVALYAGKARQLGTARVLVDEVDAVWRRADAAMPGSDFTRIFPFLTDKPE
ncbi:MAG: NAD(P)-dependent oxidoreductase [Geminicoccaceae bacterium]